MPPIDTLTYEQVLQEYRVLAAHVVYAEYEGGATPEDEARLAELAERRVELSAPDFAAMIGAAA